MSLKAILVGGVAAAGLAIAGMSMGAIGPQSTEVRISMPSPTPERAPPTQTAAREEGERIRDLIAIPPRLYRRYWDGKNRTSGDRAHKRMKRRRASGRRS